MNKQLYSTVTTKEWVRSSEGKDAASKKNIWITWFAGFMDGDGSILVYKDHVSIEATTSLEDEGILSEIKKIFGGSIKTRSNARALRWRTRKKDVVIKVINTLNGNIYNTLRLEQLKKACLFYNIEFKEKIINDINIKEFVNNSYLTGLFDADGSISITCLNKERKNEEGAAKAAHDYLGDLGDIGDHGDSQENLNILNISKKPKNILKEKSINIKENELFQQTPTLARGKGGKDSKELTNISGLYGKVQRLIYSKGNNQCIIKCTNKSKINIDMFKSLNIGKFYFEHNKQNQTKWHWIIQKKEIYIFLEYLKKFPLKGLKKKRRFHLIPEYIRLKSIKAHLAPEESKLFKEWKNFCIDWYNLIEP